MNTDSGKPQKGFTFRRNMHRALDRVRAPAAVLGLLQNRLCPDQKGLQRSIGTKLLPTIAYGRETAVSIQITTEIRWGGLPSPLGAHHSEQQPRPGTLGTIARHHAHYSHLRE
jgi:hypothetical protein